MPIYEYQCNDCTTIFETLVISATKSDKVVCSHCKGTNVRKILSGSSFRLRSVSSAPTGAQSGCNPRGGFS
ncbi:zinc ribbon domain-containing protein [Desulfoprunum benzoelyticum]|uniref:Putative FmdB family regulatory protein n=1 Tax=Desulfoprunum benzoelyticum TaxID=1506996 RepID=A0A840UQL9_9BACT|nr:putative FmdB family regulatory protein [Desulfoprunum benzoelyticum]MBM9531231.1 zinc ribbon domain-containing protein [Desulfoprunum benzoelyticum]